MAKAKTKKAKRKVKKAKRKVARGSGDTPGNCRVKITESKDELAYYLKQMMRIRAFEEKVFELLARDLLQGASHVYAGQEAVAVGACAAIGPDDLLTSTHRGHGHCVARGGELKYMLAELCGKATGYCRGRGGSMHIADVSVGNLGATGIVAGNIPVGTGAAIACKFNDRGQATLCFFGDGASNNGTFHESLNLAGAWKLPVVYCVENNLYGMSVPFKFACAVDNVADRAPGYNMPGVMVDGMRVLEVKRAVEKAVEHARSGRGPYLVEAKTYRYRGHSRSDPCAYRTKEEEKYYHDRDPILQLSILVQNEKIMTKAEIDAVQAEVDAEMVEAERFAIEESPYPDPSELTQDVYAEWREGPLGLEPV
jgi:TPP-dependent pyruvate/acetoin dehydrogenase alpha subunit